MPLYLPKGVSSQPPIATRINWNNPITKNLVVARVPGDDPSGSFNLTVDGYGVSGRQTTKNGLLSTNSAVGSTSFSFLILFRTQSSFPPTSNVIGRGVNSPAGSIGFGYAVSHSNATYAGAFFVGSSYTVIGKPAGTPAVNTEYCIAGTFNGSVGYGYSNGVRTVGPTSATISDTTARLTLNADSRLGDVSTSKIYVVFYWNRVLNDNEIASVSNNPWQIFVPSSLTYLPLGAAPPASTIYEFQTFGRGIGRGIARGIA